MPTPRKPTALKELSGSAAHDPQRQNKNEPKMEAMDLPVPPGLSSEARREWKRIAPILANQMKVLTEADRGALVGYCSAFGNVVWAEKTIAKEGRMIAKYAIIPGTSEPVLVDGKPVVIGYQKHPAMGILKDALAAMRGYAQIFGLSPADRSRVAAIDAGKKPSQMANLLNFPDGKQA
jgi:P27 family predicted phage terminase small subunit